MDFTAPTGGPYRIWARATGPSDAPALLLIMGANAGAMTWPPRLVEALASEFRVIVYDHRDTGRSTWAFDEHPYRVADLAGDAVAVLDAAGVDRAHVAGMSMGGVLVQLLMADHPERLLSATAFCTASVAGSTAAGGTAAGDAGTAAGDAGTAAGDAGTAAGDAPPMMEPDPRLLELWEHLADPRDREAELDWRVEHWRLLNGGKVPFDEAAFRAVEEACVDHAGTPRNAAAHARADQSGLERDLSRVRVPFLVIEAPEDPVNPPPSAGRLAAQVPGSQLVTVPGMGHALPPAVVPEVARILSEFCGSGGL